MSGNGKDSEKLIEEISLDLPEDEVQAIPFPAQKRNPTFFEGDENYHAFQIESDDVFDDRQSS